jgi:hypothetical protein
VPIVQGYDDCVDERAGDDREDQEVKRRDMKAGERERVGYRRVCGQEEVERGWARGDAREMPWCWGCR